MVAKYYACLSRHTVESDALQRDVLEFEVVEEQYLSFFLDGKKPRGITEYPSCQQVYQKFLQYGVTDPRFQEVKSNYLGDTDPWAVSVYFNHNSRWGQYIYENWYSLWLSDTPGELEDDGLEYALYRIGQEDEEIQLYGNLRHLPAEQARLLKQLYEPYIPPIQAEKAEGKELHLLDGIAIGNINLISDTTGTVLNLDIADRHIRLTLSDNQEQCQMLCTKRIYTGYDAGQEKMQFLWFRMEQRFSCFTIHRLGVGFDGTAIALALDAEFSCQGFRFALDGLGIAIPFQPQNVADFLLSGLSISYQQSGLAIGGGFTHRKGQQGESYDGSIQITAGELSLQAVASYADGSFLAYGILRAGIGGPPAFSVTGLALGFGINQYLKLPSMEQVETYPLVAAALDSSYTADQLLEGIKEQTPLTGTKFFGGGYLLQFLWHGGFNSTVDCFFWSPSGSGRVGNIGYDCATYDQNRPHCKSTTGFGGGIFTGKWVVCCPSTTDRGFLYFIQKLSPHGGFCFLPLV